MQKSFTFLLFVCLSLQVISAKEPLKTTYRWPLDINNGFSSSFQEFRSNHFHGGIDLRTYQNIGYPVYAISDGKVFKVRVVRRGSGKGIYIKHTDGNTSICYHLERYSKKLEWLVRQEQKRTGKKYFGNLTLKPPLAVKEGDIIGYSGETGSGFPHLHLEIRDDRYAALNPFKLLKFPKPDRRAPIIKAFLLRSVGPTLINGEIGEFWFSSKPIGKHRYRTSKKAVLTGPVEPILYVIDIADTGKRVAPYHMNASVNGKVFYDLIFERFLWEENNQLGFVYDMNHSKPNSCFINLFHQPGFDMESMKINFQEVFKQLPCGSHQLKIEVTDHFGNKSIGVFPWVKVQPPVFSVSKLTFEGQHLKGEATFSQLKGCQKIDVFAIDERLQTHFIQSLLPTELTPQMILKPLKKPTSVKGVEWRFLNSGVVYSKKINWLNGSAPFEMKGLKYRIFNHLNDVFIIYPNINPALLHVMCGKKEITLSPFFTKKGNTVCHIKPPLTRQPLTVEWIDNSDSKKVMLKKEIGHVIKLIPNAPQRFRTGEFEADFSTRSVNVPRTLLVRKTSLPARFPLESAQIDISPYHFPFLDTVWYRFYTNKEISKPEQLGVFKWNRKRRKWYYAGSQYRKSQSMHQVRVISSGVFSLQRDTVKPRINSVKVTWWRKKHRCIRIVLTDQGKGINDSTLKVRINKTKVDCDYDPDWRHVLVPIKPPVKKGSNFIYIAITDRGGNPATLSKKIFVK